MTQKIVLNVQNFSICTGTTDLHNIHSAHLQDRRLLQSSGVYTFDEEKSSGETRSVLYSYVPLDGIFDTCEGYFLGVRWIKPAGVVERCIR